jgi:hypothetical protein
MNDFFPGDGGMQDGVIVKQIKKLKSIHQSLAIKC